MWARRDFVLRCEGISTVGTEICSPPIRRTASWAGACRVAKPAESALSCARTARVGLATRPLLWTLLESGLVPACQVAGRWDPVVITAMVEASAMKLVFDDPLLRKRE